MLQIDPEQAHRYAGQQGDLWDSQKDMGLAMLGVVVFVALRPRLFKDGPPQQEQKKSSQSVDRRSGRSTIG